MIKLLILTVILPFSLMAEEAILVIKSKDKSMSYKTSELLKRKDLEKVKLVNIPAYKRKTFIVDAVPVANLFKDFDIKKNEVIVFRALDGFSGPLSRDRLLNRDKTKSKAYIAIEGSKKWPKLRKGKPSAGPFFLIWKNPKYSQIVKEEWPYMLSSLEVSGTLKSMYPKVFPRSKQAEVEKGFRHYLKNCFVCHKINGQGASEFGPDLNKPMNPTEYFQVSALKKYIRDPKSVRDWGARQMQGFAKEELSDKDIEAIVLYLKHMKSLKK